MQGREKDLIDEIHERRAAILARFDNSLGKLCAHLREQEAKHPERVVDRPTFARASGGAGDRHRS
jgi:hypothetical protein